MKTTIISRVMRRLLGRLEQWRPWPIAALALVSYVPLLLTHRGQVGADTKSYLYLKHRIIKIRWRIKDIIRQSNNI